jgi:polyisoprenoid-binding protein YceI
MKSALLALLLAAPLLADTYKVDPQHSETTFRVRHMMSKVTGKFDDISGTVNIDPKKPSASSVEFSINAESVNSGVADRDKELRTADFFYVEKFPRITFKSTSIAPTKTKNVYNVTGNLTMRGVTKKITLPVTFLGYGKDPWGNSLAGFSTHTTLNRKDYGINWNKTLDNGGLLLSDDVEINIELEMKK